MKTFLKKIFKVKPVKVDTINYNYIHEYLNK